MSIIAVLVAKMLENAKHFAEVVLGMPIPEKPTVVSDDRRKWALSALHEELLEFDAATQAGNVTEAADALIDLIYFALGRLVEMGVPAALVFEEAQRANMDKQRGELSKRPYSLGFDAIKPVGWRGPDHAALLLFAKEDLQKVVAFDAMSPVFKRIQALREAKGSDYNNIPGGRAAYFPFGHFSYAHMIHTKELRIQSLLNSLKDNKTPNFESILDTVEDLVNYATFYAEWLSEGEVR